MESFEQFHDGFYNGMFIRESSVDIFIANHIKQRFVVSATEVAALVSTDIRAGNIIFDIVCRNGIEITLDDIREAHGFGDMPRDVSHVQRAMAKAQELGALILGAQFLLWRDLSDGRQELHSPRGRRLDQGIVRRSAALTCPNSEF